MTGVAYWKIGSVWCCFVFEGDRDFYDMAPNESVTVFDWGDEPAKPTGE